MASDAGESPIRPAWEGVPPGMLAGEFSLEWLERYDVVRGPVCSGGGDRERALTGRCATVLGQDWRRRSLLLFESLGQLRNPWNDNQPVRKSRDGQEFPFRIGMAIVEAFDRMAARASSAPPSEPAAAAPRPPVLAPAPPAPLPPPSSDLRAALSKSQDLRAVLQASPASAAASGAPAAGAAVAAPPSRGKVIIKRPTGPRPSEGAGGEMGNAGAATVAPAALAADEASKDKDASAPPPPETRPKRARSRSPSPRPSSPSPQRRRPSSRSRSPSQSSSRASRRSRSRSPSLSGSGTPARSRSRTPARSWSPSPRRRSPSPQWARGRSSSRSRSPRVADGQWPSGRDRGARGPFRGADNRDGVRGRPDGRRSVRSPSPDLRRRRSRSRSRSRSPSPARRAPRGPSDQRGRAAAVAPAKRPMWPPMGAAAGGSFDPVRSVAVAKCAGARYPTALIVAFILCVDTAADATSLATCRSICRGRCRRLKRPPPCSPKWACRPGVPWARR